MQAAVPEAVSFDTERDETRRLYGLDADVTRPFGQLCLTARRLVERGVRFVQLFHGGGGGEPGTRTAGSKRTTESCRRRLTSRLPACCGT
jgi:hypothetical protein